MCLTSPLAFINLSPSLTDNIKFLFGQNSKMHNSHFKSTRRQRGLTDLSKRSLCYTFIVIICTHNALNLLLSGGIYLLYLLLVTQVSWMNKLDACLRLKCKTPMKEQQPFLIGSCLDKKQVNLACEGARPSFSTFQTLMSAIGKEKKAELMWTEHEWL